jgi:hypothetical protein
MNGSDKIIKWLGLTKQQFGIIEAIMALQAEGMKATPKHIIEKDSELRGSAIQRSNFFSQLKILRNRGYVNKLADSVYEADLKSLSQSLARAEAEVRKELEDLSKARTESESFFKRLVSSKCSPVASFLEPDEMYGGVADLLANSTHFSSTGVFPRILYADSLSLMRKPGTQRYAQVMWERCIRDEKLEVNYLTNLDMPFIFRQLLSSYRNPSIVYEEVRGILEKLPNFLKQHPKLNIYYLDSPSGLDVLVPYGSGSPDIFLPVRDEAKNIEGAVHICSPDLSDRFKKLFEQECLRAVDMRSKEATQILEKAERRLDMICAKNRRKKR